MEHKGGKYCRTFTHKAVSWDGIYDIIAISIATGAIISILIADYPSPAAIDRTPFDFPVLRR